MPELSSADGGGGVKHMLDRLPKCLLRIGVSALPLRVACSRRNPCRPPRRPALQQLVLVAAARPQVRAPAVAATGEPRHDGAAALLLACAMRGALSEPRVALVGLLIRPPPAQAGATPVTALLA